MTTPFSPTGTVLLKNVSLPLAALGETSGAVVQRDIAITDGIIHAIEPHIEASVGGPVHDADKGLVLPGFVDIHTHIDKGHIWPRKENPDGTFMGALEAVANDREANWAAEDVERRMDFALRCAYAHGTVALRTHIDSQPPQHEISWDIFDKVRTRWAGRIELQASALIGPISMLDKANIRIVAERAKQSGGFLGGACSKFDRSRQSMFNVVEIAGEMGLNLDLHIDETVDPSAHTLSDLADAVLETGYKGTVLAGHCCVLLVQDETTARTTIDKVARAGISIVSLPMCNMYLQDRQNDGFVRTPRFRGATLVNELKAAGVDVALASDNTRDPFYAYGDLDMVEVLREGARITHFDHPQQDAFDWTRAISAVPGKLFGNKGTIAVGQQADLVLFRARTWTELLTRPQTDRVVLRNGKPIDRTLPDYRELDDLME